MKSVQLSYNKLKKYHSIKDATVFRKRNHIYKYAPNSKEVMEAFDSFRGTKVGKHFALATSFLYDKDMYYGYVMKYYRVLFELHKSLRSGRIRKAYAFFSELLEIVSILNDNSILYWDFHCGNIKVTRDGHPFFFDLDESTLHSTKDDEHYQLEFLSAFILNGYLEEEKTLRSYIGLLKGKNILSDSVINYLSDTVNLNSGDLPLPYTLLEEINREEVQCEIKKLIK